MEILCKVFVKQFFTATKIFDPCFQSKPVFYSQFVIRLFTINRLNVFKLPEELVYFAVNAEKPLQIRGCNADQGFDINTTHGSFLAEKNVFETGVDVLNM